MARHLAVVVLSVAIVERAVLTAPSAEGKMGANAVAVTTSSAPRERGLRRALALLADADNRRRLPILSRRNIDRRTTKGPARWTKEGPAAAGLGAAAGDRNGRKAAAR